MLVLGRKVGEAIMIGDDVEIILLAQSSKNQGRLGIKAPPHISVHRKEIYEKIQRGNEDGKK